METVGNQEYTTSYSYDGDNRLTSLESDNVFQSYTYDAYGRVTQKTAKNGDQTVMDEAITYRNAGPGGITAQPFQLIYTGTNYSTTFGYGYNTNDNIAYVNQDGNTTYYYYDSANQLIREDNSTTDTTTLWTYDAAGNILRREVYPFSGAVPDPADKISEVNYTYTDSDWGDLLKEYNGVEIAYDGIGNPVNDGTWSYTWQHGRQLASMSRIGASEQWEFTYNADGMRTQRANGERTYQYTYLGDQLTHMTVGEHTMHFTYDGAGSPLSVTYGSETYYYVTNLQGDIVTILNSSGTAVVHYAYDAWGNLISTTGDMADTLGFYNPLRYRGYVYDPETELYYLQSRYYNPEMGRFINGDTFASTGQGLLGNNMFAYCANNPVCNKDTCGALYERTSGGGGGGGGGFLWMGEPTGGGGGGYYPIPSTTAKLVALAFSSTLALGLSTEAIREETIALKSSRSYCVYTLTDPTKTKVEYVGRTKNPDIRKDAHSRSAARGHLEFNIVASDLDYATARGMEQVLMLYHHTLNRENEANNQINGISPYNPQVDIYMDAAVKYLKYSDNQISNDILNFLGI